MEKINMAVKAENDLAFRILKGIRLAHKRMIKYKIRNNQSVVFSHNGKIIDCIAADFHKYK